MSNDALTTPRIMYYQITFTLDKRIRGRYEMPHTVKIKSKDFLDYVSEKNRNILMYFKNEHDIYINMPDEIEGQIIKRKDYVDFMDFSPACLSLKAVVSAKVKNVLEQIHVRKSEYILKRIKIDGIASDFYLLFVPIIKDTEFVYPKCEFIDIYNEKCKVFQNRKEFYNDNDIYFPKRITLTPKYRNQDLLYPQGSDVFFSKRVLDAFADEKIVGYDIIRGGCFYCTVETTDEI